MKELLDEQTSQLESLKEYQDLTKKQEEDLERMQHELNDATNLALSAQRQLDETHLEIQKLKEWNSKAKEHHELEMLSLTKKVDELEEANKGFVLNLERNESCMRIENAPGACEIQMVETHVSQQISEELILVTHFFYYYFFFNCLTDTFRDAPFKNIYIFGFSLKR